jgi:hypothetical protein
MPAAEALEINVLTHQFRSGTWGKPATLYVGLLLATPEDVDGMVEVSAPEYGRIARHPADDNWLTDTDNSVANAQDILFAKPDTDWGLVIAVGLFDAESGGALRAYQMLDETQSVLAGGPLLMFQPGSLTWRMNDLTP